VLVDQSPVAISTINERLGQRPVSQLPLRAAG
jgi:hypothetical protein